MTDAQPRRSLEFALLALLALLWGSSYLFMKIAVAEIPPITLVSIRVTVALAFLVTVLALRGEKLPRDGRTWRMLLVQSVLGSIGAWTLLAWGQRYVDAALASVLNSTSPIFVFFLTLLVTRHEPGGPLRLFGACLGLGGVILIVGVDALGGLGQQVAGQLAALAGAFLYGCSAIYARNFSHLTAAATGTGTMIWSAIFLVPLSLILEKPWTISPSADAVMAALALSVFSTGLGLLIYFRLIRTLGSLSVASQSYLRAGVGVALGMIFLGEEISTVVAIGLIAAIAGVAAINAPRPAR